MRNTTARCVAAALTLIAILAGAAQAVAQTVPSHPPTYTGGVRFLCASGGRTVVQDGRHKPQVFVRNAYWHGRGKACLRSDGRASFTVLHEPRRDPHGKVVGFPDLSRGCHWAHCTPGDTFPVRVRRIRSMPSYVATRDARHGTYNRAYDIWFSKHEVTTQAAHPDGTEMMIWTGEHGHCCWAGAHKTKVHIDGLWWWRYRTVVYDHSADHRFGGMRFHWNYLQYRIIKPRRSVHLDLANFVRDAKRIRVVRPYWYLECVEYGFEIWSGGHGLAVKDFRVGVRKW